MVVGNELDLYASYSFGKFGLTLTNYSFPGEGGAYAQGEGLFEGDYLEISGFSRTWTNKL